MHRESEREREKRDEYIEDFVICSLRSGTRAKAVYYRRCRRRQVLSGMAARTAAIAVMMKIRQGA